MVPVAGSAYTYAYAALGEIVAWVIGWDLILEYGISVAPLAATFSGSLQQLLGGVGVALPNWAQTANVVFTRGGIDVAHSQVDVIAFIAIILLAIILAAGIRESSATNVVLVIVQLVALVGFVVFLGGAIHPAAYHPFAPLGLHGIVTSAAVVFFAYIGFDTVTVASEEARNPRRDVPRAIIVSLIVGAVLFSAVAAVAVGVVAWDKIDVNSGMLDAVKHAGNNPLLFGLVLIGTVTGTFGLDADLVAGANPHLLRDVARPAAAAGVRLGQCAHAHAGADVADDRHRRRDRRPRRSADVLLEFVNIGTLSAFVIVCVGVAVLRFTHPDAVRTFRVPFGPIAVPAIGIVLCVWLTVEGLQPLTWLRFLVWFAVGLAIYALYGYRHSLLRRA
jgi:APA family basic amino acid/polyamine antiporter